MLKLFINFLQSHSTPIRIPHIALIIYTFYIYCEAAALQVDLSFEQEYQTNTAIVYKVYCLFKVKFLIINIMISNNESSNNTTRVISNNESSASGVGETTNAVVLNVRDTFPSRNSLIQTFNEQKFNSLLSCIKSKIDNANLINLNYIKMYNISDLTNYNNETIINIRSFLLNNGYFIIELEDINSNIIGWKLSW